MNTTELLKYHEELCSKARAIMEKKNHDYSGASGETPFLNFEVVERVGIIKTEEGFLVRVLDKIMRINTFLKAGKLKVTNESAEDACLDIINYFILLAAYIKDKHSKEPYCEPLLNKAPEIKSYMDATKQYEADDRYRKDLQTLRDIRRIESEREAFLKAQSLTK
jgi:hypothetical protein